MRIADLEGVGADAPRVGEEAVAATQCSAIRQEVLCVQGNCIARARARINFPLEREQLIVRRVEVAERAIRVVEITLVCDDLEAECRNHRLREDLRDTDAIAPTL